MARRYTGQGGSPIRKLRYPIKLTTKVSKDADQTLDEMATARDTKKATLVRRAVMKDIYIYKAEKEKREKLAFEGDNND